ncbi:hypothetical protein [Magnetospirillum molischianum]|uniref:Uncharacterized protein n=1 Tax=Magnetospirillum molischianum DSM 120 TaxID=1150626 RepID=H8FRR7_MAGML|nr:hypothetical protein [Magnetospirillum molischianum]CCG41055.1 conserved hypothetical protein [Magnetospirillum molischianum DSM 120]
MSVGDDLTITQSVAFAVLHALDNESNAAWVAWAKGWLNGDDRSATAAAVAAESATVAAARHAANAARLFDLAQSLQTEAAMLSAEGRNAGWTLDAVENRNTECLVEVAEAIRLADGSGLQGGSSRSAELLAQVVRDH